MINHDYGNEEHVRLSLVARVLQKLEWDVWNPKEVNTEFVVVPSEDNKKVDVALFLRPFVPSVFIETKAVGQMQGNLSAIEIQMRNYNRDNQAMFTVITDGRIWRFYLSSASGEFSRRCFQTLDLLKDDLEQVEAGLSAFLKRSEIENDNARQRLSKKPTYRKAYDAIGDAVLIGAAVRKLREDAEMTQQELAGKLEISQFHLSRIETGSGRISPDVVAVVVRYFEEELRELRINIEPWLAMTPKTAPAERPLSQQRPIMPENLSRTRRPAATEKLAEGVLHDRPVHKHGTPH